METVNVVTLRPACPRCHIPVRDDQRFIVHDGHAFHTRCAPVPEISADKDNPYPQRIAI